jgi:hypothetical protein
MFYTKRLMLRSIEPEADLNMWTQWLNDVDYVRAIYLDPPTPSSKTNAKKALESFVADQSTRQFFVICKRPSAEDQPKNLEPGADLFLKDGSPRYPGVGILSLGRVNTRVARLGIALSRDYQGT